MRVLIVNMTFDPAEGGGTADRASQLARALLAAGDEVAVLMTGRVSEERRRFLRGTEIIALPLLNRRFWVPLPLPGRIRDAVAAADIVILSNHWMTLNALAARAARKLRKPYVALPSGALRLIGRSQRLKNTFNALAGFRLIRDAAAHIATTEDEVADFLPYGIASDRVVVIPNAVIAEPPGEAGAAAEETRAFRVRHAIGSAPFILFTGRLAIVKAPDLLLEAFRTIAGRIPHHLVFAGRDEGLLKGLRAAAREAGLEDRVHFVGFISGNEKAAMLQAADLVTIPSRSEAMSLVVLEAGLASRPVVISDRCGVGELAEAGYVTLAGADSESLATQIVRVLGSDDRDRMAAAFRDYVLHHYTWEAVVEQYRELFRRVVTKGVE